MDEPTGMIAPQQSQAVQPFTAVLYDRWCVFLQNERPNTRSTYTRNLRPFFLYLRNNGIFQPQREDVIAFREALKADHKPTTVQAYIIAVKLFFQWTEQEGLYPNIAHRVKGVKLTTEHKRDYLTSDQTVHVLASIDRTTLRGKRDYAIFALMVTSGLRTIEVSRANLEDLRVLSDFTVLFIQGKGCDDRADYVKIPMPVKAAIDDYLQARNETDRKAPLFVSTAYRNPGERMTTRSISRIVKECLVRAGLDSDRLTAHSLRHTAATLNLLNGGSVEETQQLLRHTNINTTLIYSHALERAKNCSEDRVAAAIFGS